jgi:hypothetical protein
LENLKVSIESTNIPTDDKTLPGPETLRELEKSRNEARRKYFNCSKNDEIKKKIEK